MIEPLSFQLPWPPTSNNLFTNREFGGRRISPSYKAFASRVGELALTGQIKRFAVQGRLGCSIIAHPPDYRARDLDNLFKATFDSLKKAGVIADDSAFDLLRIARGEQTPGGRLDVQIWELARPSQVSQGHGHAVAAL